MAEPNHHVGGADPAPWVVVVAAGRGERFGGPKQLLPLLGGQRPVDRAIAVAAAVAGDQVVVVVPPDHDVGALGLPAGAVVVPGGATRSASVRAGLAAMTAAGAPDDAVVAIHDAARPWATAALFERVVAAVAAGADGAVPAIAVADTVKRVAGDRVVETLDRSTLVAVQTPQAFRLRTLVDAHRAGNDATDDAALVEAIGGTVVTVPGAPDNRKITVPADVEAATAGLAALRIGTGFDSHARGDDPHRPLVLGGVTFTGEPGLVGHSDGDAIAHAVTDALLGAAGLGDIGALYPDTDPRLEGADSVELLRGAVGRVVAAGWRPVNVDCVVVAERPKLAPQRGAIEARLGEVVGAPVTVKGKRPEGLAGVEATVACWATALLVAQ